MAYLPSVASAMLMTEASKAAFSPDFPEERVKFWDMFRIRALKEFGQDIADELSLSEHWDADKAFKCFKDVMATRKFRLGKITPRAWDKAIKQTLEATEANKGRKASFPLSCGYDDEALMSRCYAYELQVGIPGAAGNPFWSDFVLDHDQYRSVLVPDLRKNSAQAVPTVANGTGKNRRMKYAVAGFPIPRETVVRIDSHLVHPAMWAALKYGKYGLAFARYMASNHKKHGGS